MLREIFAVYDGKAKLYMEPFFAINRGCVLRDMHSEMRKAESPLRLHPEDFGVFKIAVFDSETGEILPCEPELCFSMEDLVAAP
ncbi:MAG: nonstructural protein [Microvirus sp.]|nr:MAG: nonstructural protein [Microvirus sp.]